MDIFLAILPAIFWGSIVLFNVKLGGSIINLTSGQSVGPMPDELAYAATKGAIEAFTKSVAPVAMEKGITVNAVDPGPTNTGWITEELKHHLVWKFPQGKVGEPVEPVANNNSKVEPAQPEPSSKPTAGGKEIYVEATAYTADPGENGYAPGQQVFSAWGHYNLTANPGMKLIAVDPKVIPLGKTVNVEAQELIERAKKQAVDQKDVIVAAA
ncbi:SDR family oxidoreductase, partial [Bacillus sp. HC-Mk]